MTLAAIVTEEKMTAGCDWQIQRSCLMHDPALFVYLFYVLLHGGGILKIWWVTDVNVHQENKGKCKYQGKINLFVYMKSNKLRKISNSLCYYIHMYIHTHIHTLTLTHSNTHSLTHLTHSRTDARMYAWMHGTIHQIWMQVWSHRHKRMFLVRLGVSGGCTLWVN